MDMNDPSSRWCWERSRESAHFYCFWEKEFGPDPMSAGEAMRVDLDDLLDKAERFWRTNAETVHMVDPERSRLKTYKMQIYLLYTDEWIATGSGYDDVIGALWVSPATCQPVGSVIAHEVAHCFQYQVYCDQLLNGETEDHRSGFRYAHGAGNAFWEQCAQWVSTLDYPEAAIEEMGDWARLSNLSFEHEWTRYQSYWLPMFWAEERGASAIGDIWRESRYPEDALSAYVRLFCGDDVEKLNDELYRYAVSMISKTESAACYDAGDGWMQIGYASCPGLAGYCVVALPPGTSQVMFEGLPSGAALAPDDPGLYRVTGQDEPIAGGRVASYNAVQSGPDCRDAAPGWRYGLVAITDAGDAIVGEMGRRDGVASVAPPEDTASAYLVVVGAPHGIVPNPWDDDERTDAQFPFRFKVLTTGG